jgi:hypothetical protein
MLEEVPQVLAGKHANSSATAAAASVVLLH